MSQQGYLLVVKPSLIDKVCRGWPEEPDVPPDPGALSAEEAIDRLKHAKPFSFERTWSVASSCGARMIRIGYHRKRPGSAWYMHEPVYMYQLDDVYFDERLSRIRELGKFASAVARYKAGLRVYWFLWSY